MDDTLHLAIVRQDATVRITCAGAIDMTTAARLDTAVREALESGHSVEVDLSNVDFFGSDGLRILTRAERQSKALGVGFQVRPSRAVRRVLDLSGLTGRIHIT